MRTATFLSICAAIAAAITLLIHVGIAYIGLNPPFGDSLIFEAIKFAFVVPVVVLALNPVNQQIRNWRKARGRDVEEEEKFETESGIISITQKNK